MAQEAAALRAGYNFKPPDALIMGTGRAYYSHHLMTNDEEWKQKLSATSSLGMAVCYLADHLPFP